jgi:hypothetical protein
MYYPECNVLISRHVDPQSKTPEFKCVTVRIELQSANKPSVAFPQAATA